MRLLAGCRFACFQSCHAALSLPLVRCCCSVRLRAACFDCPVPCDLPRLIDCPFLIKAFQRMRCPAVLPVAVSWRLRPHHLAHHLGWWHRLLCSSMSSPLYRLIACVPSSSRAVASSSIFPASLLAWLVGSALFVISLVISGNSACVPLLGSPLVPFSPGMSSPSCLIAPRAALLVAIDRPALLVGWLGAGRDGSHFSPSPARLAAVACSGWRLACVRFLVAVCSACFGAAVCVCIVMAKLYI